MGEEERQIEKEIRDARATAAEILDLLSKKGLNRRQAKGAITEVERILEKSMGYLEDIPLKDTLDWYEQHKNECHYVF